MEKLQVGFLFPHVSINRTKKTAIGICKMWIADYSNIKPIRMILC